MKSEYQNLISQIKSMINHEDGIYEMSLLDHRIDRGRNEGKEKQEPVRMSHDKTKIICDLYYNDTLDQMADKILKAESMMDEALKFSRYKKQSPYLVEALQYNIPELTQVRSCHDKY